MKQITSGKQLSAISAWWIVANCLLLVAACPAPAQTTGSAESILDRKAASSHTPGVHQGADKGTTSRTTEQLLFPEYPGNDNKAVHTDSVRQKKDGRHVQKSAESKQKQQATGQRLQQEKSSEQPDGAKQKKQVNTSDRKKQGKDEPISTMLHNVRLDFSYCFYDAASRSVACRMELTSLQHGSDVTFLCYTGSEATDSAGHVQECAHTWIGNSHSWNYAHAELAKGEPIRAMVRFKTGGMVNPLNMRLVFDVDGSRQMVTLRNVPVLAHKEEGK